MGMSDALDHHRSSDLVRSPAKSDSAYCKRYRRRSVTEPDTIGREAAVDDNAECAAVDDHDLKTSGHRIPGRLLAALR